MPKKARKECRRRVSGDPSVPASPVAADAPPTGSHEQTFRLKVQAEYTALHPVAEGLLHELLRQFDPARACPLPCGLEIRDLGRAAGRCTREGAVVVNSQLIDHPDAMRETVAHELAHAVVETARRELLARNRMRCRRGAFADMARRRGAWSTHGETWKTVARELGDGGERCHRLPLKPRRRLRRFLYRSDCGAEVVLSSVRHNRLQRNRGMEYRLAGRDARVGWRHFVGEVEADNAAARVPHPDLDGR